MARCLMLLARGWRSSPRWLQVVTSWPVKKVSGARQEDSMAVLLVAVPASCTVSGCEASTQVARSMHCPACVLPNCLSSQASCVACWVSACWCLVRWLWSTTCQWCTLRRSSGCSRQTRPGRCSRKWRLRSTLRTSEQVASLLALFCWCGWACCHLYVALLSRCRILACFLPGSSLIERLRPRTASRQFNHIGEQWRQLPSSTVIAAHMRRAWHL